jgi:hypothetical protein
MRNLRLQWLLHRGYKITAVRKINNYWGTTYLDSHTELTLKKNMRFKKVLLKVDVADIILKEVNSTDETH